MERLKAGGLATRLSVHNELKTEGMENGKRHKKNCAYSIPEIARRTVQLGRESKKVYGWI